jgi:hypothetical protein
MDQILSKHLANAFLFPKDTDTNIITESVSEGMIPYNTYKIIDNRYYINLETDTVISETYGYWKDKPIVIYKEEKYVLLENSTNIVKLEYLGITEDNITKLPTLVIEDNIIPYYYYTVKKNKIYIKIDGSNIVSENKGYWNDKHVVEYNKQKYAILENSKELVKLSHLGVSNNNITKKPQSVKKQEEDVNKNLASSIKDIIKKAPKKSPEDEEKEVPTNMQPLVGVDISKLTDTEEKPSEPTEDSIISSYINASKKKQEDDGKPEKEEKKSSIVNGYVDNLKNTENPSEIIGKDLPAGGVKAGEFDFFSFLEKHKDDPRINKFFATQTDGAKKELFAITEKYEKEFKLKLAHALESGGGTNSFGYGGIVNGTIDIRGDLKVSGNIEAPNSSITFKRVFQITDNNQFTLTHNLKTKSLIVNVYDNNGEQVFCDVKNISIDETLVTFTDPVQNYEVVIIG